MRITETAAPARLPQTSTLSRWTRTLLSFCALGLPLSAGLAMGYVIGHQPPNAVEDELGAALRERMKVIDPKRVEVPGSPILPTPKIAPQVDALTGRMAVLEQRLIPLREHARLDDVHKFPVLNDVTAPPTSVDIDSIGRDIAPESRSIYQAIEQLSRQIDSREQDNLDAWLAHRQTGERAIQSAEPVYRAGISSYFGMRIDPFSGRRAMHEGIDFSAKPGTAIMAAGDGVVTFAGAKPSYGYVVEIDHGEDCYTRYAHSKFIVVRVGDLVKKGQVIALMGSSGRATGSHLHFEVYKHGRAVDPFVYIRQASR